MRGRPHWGAPVGGPLNGADRDGALIAQGVPESTGKSVGEGRAGGEGVG